MDLGELERALRAAVPGVRVPPRRPGDDLYAFRFAGQAFAPPFMDALVRLAVGAGIDAGTDGGGTGTDGGGTGTDGGGTGGGGEEPESRLRALAGLLEGAFAGDDEELVDGLAMRLVWSRLLRRPGLLAVAWPHLGPATRRVVRKFQTLEAGCAAREAALTGDRTRSRGDERAAERAGEGFGERGEGSGARVVERAEERARERAGERSGVPPG